jgi:hypothetical protein
MIPPNPFKTNRNKAMRHLTSALILATALGVAGCAATGGPPAGIAPSTKARMASLTQTVLARGGQASQLFFVEIPGTGRAIADMLATGLINSGTPTNAMDGISELLQQVPDAHVVIHGASDMLTAASVRGVLRQHKTTSGRPLLWVALASPADHEAGLHAAANAARVRLEVIQAQ